MAPLVRLGALVAVVGLTALPFASCAGIDFVGHEILRNEPPDGERVTKGALGPLAPEGGPVPGAERSWTDVSPEGRLFDGGDRWLHWLYVGVVVLAVLALVLPARGVMHAVLAVLGIAGTVLFLESFERRLGAEDTGPASFLSADLRWEAGAYVTLAGFGLVLVAGWPAGLGVRPRRGRRPA
jgi:hypothetical protein